MKRLIFLFFLLFGCKSLEYPVVTRYKEPKIRYVKIKETKQNKHKNKTNWEVYTFTLATLMGFYYISNAK